jgi:DUF4097 and DUF4098 domain-containing protein YvlB
MRSERFETPGALAIRVDLASADLDVSTWGEGTTQVEIVGRKADDATVEAIESFVVELHPRSGGHELVIREPKRFGFRLRSPQLTVRVRCPEGASLAVSGASADVRVDGALDAVDVKTASGDVVLGGALGTARVTSQSGDVALDATEREATVATASGDVRLGRIGGALVVTAVSGDVELLDGRAGATIQTVSGDVELRRIGGGDIRLQTVSGDVRIALEPGLGVWIDAGSVSGDVVSDLELGDAPAAAEEEPIVELRVKSVSGDVLIGRAAVASPSSG